MGQAELRSGKFRRTKGQIISLRVLLVWGIFITVCVAFGSGPACSYSSSPDSEWPWVKASTQSVVLPSLSPVKIDEYEQMKLKKLINL